MSAGTRHPPQRVQPVAARATCTCSRSGSSPTCAASRPATPQTVFPAPDRTGPPAPRRVARRRATAASRSARTRTCTPRSSSRAPPSRTRNRAGRHAWLQVARGRLRVNGQTLVGRRRRRGVGRGARSRSRRSTPARSSCSTSPEWERVARSGPDRPSGRRRGAAPPGALGLDSGPLIPHGRRTHVRREGHRDLFDLQEVVRGRDPVGHLPRREDRREHRGAWIQEQKVKVKAGKVVEYRVNMKVTFVLN